MPASPGAGPAAGGIGVAGPPPVTFRGPTAKGLLGIDWEYPIYVPPEEAGTERSAAKAIRRALSREEALKVIAGDDPRPLLVLRECKVCNGTDEALLKGGIENEQTFLMARWFHCVKLPVDVLEEDHPFHNLFVQEQPEHLFISSPDGSNHDPLESQTSRTELWKSMRELLGREYKAKPESSLKRIGRLLDGLDEVDSRFDMLAARRDDILEEDGPEARKLGKVLKEIEELEEERANLKAEIAEASVLELVRPKPEIDPARDGQSAKDAETAR